MNRRLRQRLDCAGVEIHDMQVGSYVTSQEMAGASISAEVDGELAGYFDRPCSSRTTGDRGRRMLEQSAQGSDWPLLR